MTAIIDSPHEWIFSREIVQIKETIVVIMKSIILFIFTDVLFCCISRSDNMFIYGFASRRLPIFSFSDSAPARMLK
jgi:hypothetical protein